MNQEGGTAHLSLTDPSDGGFISAFASTVLTEKVTAKLMGKERA